VDPKKYLVPANRDEAWVEDALRQGGYISLDELSGKIPPEESCSRPPRWLNKYAALVPGGWVSEPEDNTISPDLVPPSTVRGAWKVGPDGEITGQFKPNPDYRPIGFVDPDTKPLPPEESVLRLFPEIAWPEITHAVLKLGTPKLIADVLFNHDYTLQTRGGLIDVLIDIVPVHLDEDGRAMPEMLWFEALIDYATDYTEDAIVDLPPDYESHAIKWSDTPDENKPDQTSSAD